MAVTTRRRLTGAALAAVAGLMLTGCGGASSPDAGSPTGDGASGDEAGRDEAAASGRTLWVLDSSLMITGVDAGSGEVVAGPTDQVVEPFSAEVNALAAAAGQVWVTRSDGQVVVIDGASGEVADTLTFETGRFGINEFAVGGESVYLAYGAEDGNPVVARLDLASRSPQAEAPVIGDIHAFEGFAVDGDTLWVLQGNGFALYKVDAQDLTTLGSVPLGRSSSSPDSPLADLYGHGYLAVVGDTVWVVDIYHKGLLRVDKATLAAEVVADLSDLITDRQVRLVANSTSFFVAASDDNSGEVARFDGATGERQATYQLGEGGAETIAVTDERLYVNQEQFPGQIVEIDIATGQVLRSYDVYGDLIALE